MIPSGAFWPTGYAARSRALAAQARASINRTACAKATTPARFAAFNPFTTTPVRGVNWDYGPVFGTALNRFAYTTPRTVRMSFGLRF